MEGGASSSPNGRPTKATNRHRTYSYSCNPRTDQLVSVQSRYIENLQQQIFYLESERNQINDSGRCRPKMIIEMENMVDKLMEAEKINRRLTEELERRDFTIGNLNQEKDRLKSEMETTQEAYSAEKMSCVQELVQIKQEKAQIEQRLAETEGRAEVYKESEEIAIEKIRQREATIAKLTQKLQMSENLIKELKQEIQDQQAAFYKEKMAFEKEESPSEQMLLIGSLRKEIQDIRGKLKQTEERLENEKMIREKLTSDNEKWIQVEAELTTQVAELKMKVSKEETRRQRAEKHYNDLVNEIAEAQAITLQQKALLEQLNKSIESDKQGRDQIEAKLYEEQYHKNKLERTVEELQKKLEEQTKRTNQCLEQNCNFQSDNIMLKDNVAALEEKLNKKELEIEKMKQRIVDMKKSVDAIVQQNEASLQIQDCRWRHMSQLAQGIQQLSQDATSGRS